MGSDSFWNTSYTSIDAIYRVIEESLPIQLWWYTVDVGQVTTVEEIQESQSLIRKILNQHRKHVIRFLLPKQQGITQKGKIILQRHQDLKEHSLYT
jgi:hypothetical protein